MTGVRRTIPVGKAKAKAIEEKENTEAKEDWEAKEHSRTPGRQRILDEKDQEEEHWQDVKETVVRMMMSEEEQEEGDEEQSEESGEQDWQREDEEEGQDQTEVGDGCEVDERVRVAPNMEAGGSHLQVTSDPG